MPETRLFTAEPDAEIARKNQAFLNRWTPVGASVIRPFMTEPVKVHNADVLQDVPSPMLLLLNHDSREDLFTLMQVWREHTTRFPVRGVSRPGILKPYWLDRLVMGKWLKPILTDNMIRTDFAAEQHLSEEERQQRNEEGVKRNIAELRSGINLAMAPTGDTHGNGEFSKVKSGAFKMSHLVDPETGDINLLQLVPVITTYDWMAGDNFLGRTRAQVFTAIGQPYTFEPSVADGRFSKEDAEVFADEFKKRWAQNTTITTSHLGGWLFDDAKQKKWEFFPESALNLGMLLMIDRLQGVQPEVLIDGDLLQTESRHMRQERFYNQLIHQKYLHPNGQINYGRPEPDPENFKKTGPVEYAANRLQSVMQYRTDISHALRTLF